MSVGLKANVDGTSGAVQVNGNDVVTVNSSGQVGIGTASPGAPLNVSGASQTDIFKVQSSTGTTSFRAYIDDTVGRVDLGAVNSASTTFAKYLTFSTAPASGATTERMRIESTGKVGIGTTAPARALQVSSEESPYQFRVGASDIYNYDIGRSGTDGLLYFYGNQSGFTGYVFSGANGERMRINGSGNVGIGADAGSGYRFLVQGSTSDTTTYPIVVRNSSSVNLFYIRADGYITAPQTYNVIITSAVRDLQIDSNGILGYISSVRASKTNITTLTDVSWLNQLQPCTFNYRKRDDEGNYTDEVEPELQYGLIAEEVEQVNPELVFYDQTENGPELRGVSYSKLVVPLLAKIQQLEARLAALEAK